MFTGIIHHTAALLSRTPSPSGVRLELSDPFPTDDHPKLGDSIAVNGCCLTVAAMSAGRLAFDVIPESLEKTNLGALPVGGDVNLERSLRFGDRVDGHVVQGHVDATATVVSVETRGEWRVTLRAPAHLAKYLIPKGSVALDGVSLTLARVGEVGGNDFDVTLIPTTLDLTTLRGWKAGGRVNLECDHTVKTIVSTLERMGVTPPPPGPSAG